MARPAKYLRVKKSILQRIASGRIGPGDSAGSEAELSKQHDVSKFTVIKAFTELVSEGVLYRQQGKGTFVTGKAGKGGAAPAGRSVRLLRPYREIGLEHLAPGLGRFRARFGPRAVEFTDDRNLSEVEMSSVALGAEGAARLLPLDNLLAASSLAGGYDDTILGLFRRGGSLYALPRDYSPVLLFYNAELFERRGVGLPDDSWTWDDLARATADLTDREAGVYGYAAGRGMIFLAHFLRQNGGAIVDEAGQRSLLDSAESMGAVRYYRGLERSSPVTAGGITYGDMLDAFVEGRIAMIGWGGAVAPMLESRAGFRWGAAPLPRGRVRATVFFAAGLTIRKTVRDADLAWELVRELAGPETQAALASLSYYLPACRGVGAAGSLAETMRRELPHTVHRNALSSIDAYHVASEQLVKLWDEIEDDGELARELADRVNMYLELSRSGTTGRLESAMI